MDKLRGEFIDIIEWTQPTDRGILAFRFPRVDAEIKMGARLVVREGQAAVFVNEGQLADVFKPGTHTLTTQNLPILSTLRGWKHGFNSPYKAEVYFINTAQQPDYKWGTSSPIMLRDNDFGIVRLRGFGSYVFRVSDPAVFLKELVATDPCFEDYEIDAQLRQVIVAKFSDVLGKSGIPVLDLCGNYEALAKFVFDRIAPEFSSWGLEIVKFYIENLSLPPAVQEAIDRRTSMGVVGDLTKYTQFQAAEALRVGAENGGGGAGVTRGAGLAVGNLLASALGQSAAPQTSAPAQASAPPPLPGGEAQFHLGLNGKTQGPYATSALAQLVRDGVLAPDTLVWRQGMADWVRAETVTELAPLFRAAPPPLPRS
jgi:membrane protease subunit (stomatin/prohibitin family)